MEGPPAPLNLRVNINSLCGSNKRYRTWLCFFTNHHISFIEIIQISVISLIIGILGMILLRKVALRLETEFCQKLEVSFTQS